jgi:6-phosphogluconolactonase
MVRMRALRFLTLLPAIGVLAGAAGNMSYFAYIGTYTGHGSQGIYVYRFEPATGALTSLGLAAQTDNPSFLAAGPGGAYLYAVNEDDTGSVSAFRVDRKSGKLTPLNRVSSGGSSPCALAVDHSGRFVLAANYGSGSIGLFPIKADGRLAPDSAFNQHNGSSINRQRQAGPHAHSASFSPDNRFALSADLGVDLIYVYGFDAKRGTLATVGYGHVAPGSGPRHLAFHPNGKFVYVVDELAATVNAFAWNEGALKALGAVSAVAPGYRSTKSGAEIAVHPNGKFVYASNRGQANDIAIFHVDPSTGKLTPAGRVASGGQTPRSFSVDPSGQYLFVANQDSNNVVVFHVDPTSGQLTPTGKTLAVSSPVAVQFVAAE